MTHTDKTEIETAQAAYDRACEAYEKQIKIPTQRMTAAVKKSHLTVCMKRLEEKRAARTALNNALASRTSPSEHKTEPAEA